MSYILWHIEISTNFFSFLHIPGKNCSNQSIFDWKIVVFPFFLFTILWKSLISQLFSGSEIISEFLCKQQSFLNVMLTYDALASYKATSMGLGKVEMLVDCINNGIADSKKIVLPLGISMWFICLKENILSETCINVDNHIVYKRVVDCAFQWKL